MPTRIIRDGILTSERINLLSTNAELFYRRLMSVVDDYGRFPATPMLLRASCYPLKLDSVKEDSISKHLAECVDAELIVLYTVEGKALLQMQDFGQRINGKPKYPGPGDAGSSPGIPGKIRLDVDVGEDVIEDEKGRSPGKLVLPDWLDNEAWNDWHAYRNSRKGWTKKARELSLATLSKLRDEGQNQKAVIEQSIEKGWTGLFSVKTPFAQQQPQKLSGAHKPYVPERRDRVTSEPAAMKDLMAKLGLGENP